MVGTLAMTDEDFEKIRGHVNDLLDRVKGSPSGVGGINLQINNALRRPREGEPEWGAVHYVQEGVATATLELRWYVPKNGGTR